ncbi:beta-ketoacyl synthase N-terminal-like domain-containing protein [Paenibacillus sp. FSL R7-0312]|uniref:beta-ketoacyl synthase N-terminal-like domain-containing protein n=1 Tax=Paenibacillus sp. FSL R7-0312 TaxID=2921682 RepID=UPI0030F9E78A
MKQQLVFNQNNPMIRHHQVCGQSLLPGQAYIDILYQIFRKYKYRFNELELRNLSIHQPLTARPGEDIVLTIQVTETAEGRWTVRFGGESRRSGICSGEEILYAAAEMHRIGPVLFDEQLYPDEYKSSPARSRDLGRMYEEWTQRGVLHTGFMKAAGTLWATDKAYIMETAVSEEALLTADKFMFHPVLLDGSGAGILGGLFSDGLQTGKGLLLPLFYESFRASGLLQTGCSAKVLSSSVQQRGELLSMTISYYDNQGSKVAELTNFTMKLIRQDNTGAEIIIGESRPDGQQQQSHAAGAAAALKLVRKLLAEQLQKTEEELNPHAGYYELGLNSSGLLAIANAIENEIGDAVPPTLLFEHTTAVQLADYLASAYSGCFGRKDTYGKEAYEKETYGKDTYGNIPFFRSAGEPQGGEQAAANALPSPDAGADGDIAIIGMAGRYPDADGLAAFWDNLKSGKDSIRQVPSTRWQWESYKDIVSPSGKPVSRWGGFIDDPDCFDPQFFRISPREAETMDPQERLFLTVCWETVEDAGYTPGTLVQPRGRHKRQPVGVFAGVMHKDYAMLGAEEAAKGNRFPLSLNYAPIANRVSYFCNFHGPSMTIDTVCSSSLTAVHLAAESIRHGECEVALAGGVNLSLHPNKYVSYGLMDMHASDGRCRTFGEGGDGYVSSEGVGAVLLKPLRKAVRDGDSIYAVIKGSVINHVGTVSGITVPSPVGQAELISECLDKTGIDARTISYIEAHGTGTSLGDPIEMQGLVKAFRDYTSDTGFCSIGSVKSNIGHAESAAGIGGLHKVILQLYHEKLVPSLHAEEPNPYIDFAGSPFYIQRTLKHWDRPKAVIGGKETVFPRRAGISSFGATGSNAHIILEEYMPEPDMVKPVNAAGLEPGERLYLIPLSAKNKERLQAYAAKLAAFLQASLPEQKAAAVGKQHGAAILETAEHRVCSIVSDIIQMKDGIIDAEQDWSEYGLEPVHFIQLHDKLKTAFGIELVSETILALRSAAAVAKRIAEGTAGIEEEDASPAVEKSGGSGRLDAENLEAIAYTLQVGREPMNDRVICVARSSRELILQLEQIAQGKENIASVFRGAVKPSSELASVFRADEDFGELLQRWLSKGQLEKIAQLWVNGVGIEWKQLYGSNVPKRLSLPSYPFAKERYWLPSMAVPDDHAVGQQGWPPMSARRDGGALPAERSMRMLQKQWELCPPQVSIRSLSGAVAILTTEETRPLALRLARQLPAARILGSEELRSELDEHVYSYVVDLTGCGKEQTDEPDGWIPWLQRLIEQGTRDGMMLLGVTTGLEATHGQKQGPVNLAGAMRAGLYRMLQSEYSHLRSRHVDFAPDCGGHVMAETIAAELLTDSEDAEVRYLEGMRYRASLAELPKDCGEEAPGPFPEGHTLWITGGTRGIGALCAKHFVRSRGVRRLVLTGREAIPPREQWDDYTADEASPTGQKIRMVRELESLGAQVKVLALDLTDEAAVRRCISEVKAAWGGVGGVLHCAGLGNLDTPAFIRKSGGRMEEVWAPKVKGLNVLYRCMREEPLQFFVLFSSVSAIVPTLAAGQSDYAMANAYMDYAAQAWSGECPVISIQWPSWKETGLGEVKSRAYEQTGMLTHTDSEGLLMLDRILSGGLGPVVLPAVVDPRRWKPERLLLRSLRELGDARIEARKPVPQEERDAESVLPAVGAFVTGVFAKELKLDPLRLDPELPFAEYGVDSIMLAQVLRIIKQGAGTELDPSILYEHPSIRSLSAWLADNHGDSFAAHSREAMELPGQGDSRLFQPAAALKQPPVPLSGPLPQTAAAGRMIDSCTDAPNIAVIGLSCRFPGAETLDDYWRLLSEGSSAIRLVPAGRWPGPELYYAGLLGRPQAMPASVFRLSNEDAQAMDPQALLLLEESLKAWHHAGYTPEEIKERSVGVYIGARSKHDPDEASLLQARNPILAVGSNYLAANISQYFDLHGPSLVLDTACSSALVGLNLAVQALRSGEIECALVGGVSLLTSSKIHRLFQQRGILSPEPNFHVFDSRAQGVVLSEGAGVVLLKPVEQAVKDGDRIYAVIKGAAVNNDGRTAGPAVPNLQAQKEVMRQALARSGKRPEEIGYIEANGSGSVVTDLLELKAIQAVYRKDGGVPLGIGSVKPNIGHPLCAEGIAGLIKVVLMLNHGEQVPYLSGQRPMKHFDIEASPFYFSRDCAEWPGRRTAALNSFADGGTNAHVIMESWEELRAPSAVRRPLPLPEEAIEQHAGAGAVKPNWWLKQTKAADEIRG